jgi:oligopeptide transport system substrate-binding protein
MLAVLLLLIAGSVHAKQDVEPITHSIAEATPLDTIDPQRAAESPAINAVEQLFLGLTNADPTAPGVIQPELASSWEASDDGLSWTFTIRQDVPWVRWNPETTESEIVRMVTADDLVYGIQRACDPRLGAYYTYVAAQIIAGCDAVAQETNPTDDDYALVQVEAPDEATLIIHLQRPAVYFLSMTPMAIFRPVPREVIEEHGENWTDPGIILTNGPFMLSEWTLGVSTIFLSNPYLPEDLRGPGNIQRVIVQTISEVGTRFALYQGEQIDRTDLPTADIQAALETYGDQISQYSDLTVYFAGFAYDRPPFDDVHVRRAFSAMIDRSAFIQEARQNRGMPMIHLTPPGVVGAPPVNEVGVGYDPDFARAELAAAGYPDCTGFPSIQLMTYPGAAAYAEFVAASAERELGCDSNTITVVQREYSVLLEAIDPLSDNRPEMWTLSWSPDYPDANNWVGDMLGCESQNTFKRPCAEVDDLIVQAAEEPDTNTRVELYHRIEEAFFGAEGEYPIVPLFMNVDYVLTQPWLEGPLATDGIFGGEHYDWRTITRSELTGE